MFPDDTRKQRIQSGEMYSSLQIDVNFDSDQLKEAVGDGGYDDNIGMDTIGNEDFGAV